MVRTHSVIAITTIALMTILFASNTLKPIKLNLLGLITTKRVVFIGYRPHWNQTRPYQCSCEGGLGLLVNSSDLPRDARDIQDADLVIFAASGGISPIQWDKYQEHRPPGQKWLFATRESPVTSSLLTPPEKYRFNSFQWSYTYSPDASFPSPYGRYVPAKQPLYSEGEVDWSENKTKFVSWTSSNCPLPAFKWHRRDFVLKLKKYIGIDMFGKCGDLKCPKLSQECFDKLKTYKFALVLENSCCPYYITEKFWKALVHYNQVPIVFGAKREEYEHIAPPNSFIFVEDFKSLEELADYLLYLDRNNSRYKQYHKWRNQGWAETAVLPNELINHCDALCKVSSKLKDTSPKWNMFSFDPYGESWFGGCRSCEDVISHLFIAK
ncbi:putative glycoprotein 3-alpha-L-fucosyltransferase A-like [Apostichopus japonicus]|uniref:Fucosyltransferase n=2 Tax=Stichopus japonicus TaxID=307972 RepID=A0A2G8JT15_STIJA|nr:putative glycoprotein 3-alpha-L-fucosyltransferase A-like [Apostichopus japonicus]